MRIPVAILVVAALGVCLSACGGDSGGTGEGADLAAMLPADEPGPVFFADFAAAREAAGLPEDADFRFATFEGGAGGRRFAQELAAALPQLNQPPGTNALEEALDGGQVQAAATVPTVTLLRTEQEFDEIAAALEGSGGPIVLEGDEGLIGIGSDRELLERALAGGGAQESLQRTLVEELGDVAVGGVATTERPEGCVSGIAIGDEIEEGAGELLLSLDRPADPDAFLLPKAPGVEGLSPYAVFEFEEPEADGELLRVPFTYPVEEAGAPVSLIQEASVPVASFYACRGAGAD